MWIIVGEYHNNIYDTCIVLETDLKPVLFLLLQVRDFFQPQCILSVEELALSPTNGHRVRKQFKKFVKTAKEKEVIWHYGFEKPCRLGLIHKCYSIVTCK